MDCGNKGAELPNYMPPLNALFYSSASKIVISQYILQLFNGTVISPQSLHAALGSPVLQTLYNNGNSSFETVNAAMESMTNAMTVFMRTNGDLSNSEWANGTIIYTTTCVSVEWAWFALPAFLAAASIFFLISTLVNAHSMGENLNWKSSVLPYLFHGLELKLQDGSNGLKEMEKLAKEMQIQPKLSADGWHFVEAVGKEE